MNAKAAIAYAAQKRAYRLQFGNLVVWRGTTYSALADPLRLADYPLLQTALGVNLAEADPTVFEFSPADLPGANGASIPAGQVAQPLSGDIILWQGFSYTVADSPAPLQYSGVSHAVRITAFRTPPTALASTEQSGEPHAGNRVVYSPPDATT